MLPSGDSNLQGPPEAYHTNGEWGGPPELGGGDGKVLHTLCSDQQKPSATRREQEDTELQLQKGASRVEGDDSCDGDDEGVIANFDSDNDESSSTHERTEEELQDDLDRLCLLESEAAYAQEMLEKESLALVKADVAKELFKEYDGDELVDHVETEMREYENQWEAVLTALQEESTLVQERLDAAGICLPTVFKMIEKQAAAHCSTAAWRNRTHWAGLHASPEMMDIVRRAEADLECSRPVMKHQGKVVEVGASGMLARKFAAHLDTQGRKDSGWESLDSSDKGLQGCSELQMVSGNVWKEIYKATTPKQVAQLGRQLPDAYKVDEIGDVKPAKCEPRLLEALENEEKHGLTPGQAGSLKQITDEDDARKTRFKPMHIHLPPRRLGGVNQVHEQKNRDKIGSSPAEVKLQQDNSTRKRIRITPASPINARHPEDRQRDTSLDKAQSLQIVESRIAEKMKERNVLCTACGDRIKRQEVVKHPKLLVAMCRPCKVKYKHQAFSKDERGRESQCRWCTRGENIRGCEECGVSVCALCWARNFGSGESNPECIVCNKTLLKPLQRHADEVEQEGIRLGYMCAPRTRQVAGPAGFP